MTQTTTLIDRKCAYCAVKLASVPATSPKAAKQPVCAQCSAEVKARLAAGR